MADNAKKQVPLRLSPKLYEAIAAWAEDDFRSINGQIEYLLTECVKQRKKNGKYVSDTIDAPLELDIQSEQGGCPSIGGQPQKNQKIFEKLLTKSDVFVIITKPWPSGSVG